MSWTDKELSEMAKAAQAEQKFVYQDSFWTEVEAMLPAKKKRGLPFYWFALVPVAVALAYFAMLPNDGELTSLQAAKTMPTLSEGLNRTERIPSATLDNSIDGTKASSSSAVGYNRIGNQGQTYVNEGLGARTSSLVPNMKLTPELERVDPIQTSILEGSLQVSPAPDILLAEGKNSDETGLNYTKIESQTIAANRTGITPVIIAEKTESANQEYIDESMDLLRPLTIRSFEKNPSPSLQAYHPLMMSRKPWNAYAEGGFTMGQAYTSDLGFTTAFNLGGGARYDFKNYFLQLGLSGELQNVRYELSERAKIYHTSSTMLENKFSYRQLYRAEMPLTLGYQFTKHTFQMSVIPSYLVGTKMKYAYMENGTTLRDETMYETVPGDKVGWNDFTTSFGLGYGYRLTKTIVLGANVEWKLINQLSNKTAIEANTRPLSGQVFIRKTLR